MEIKTGKEMVKQFSAERGSCSHHLLGTQMDHCRRRDRFLKGAENMGGSKPVTENQGPRAWCSCTAHHGGRGRALSLQEAPAHEERNVCPGQGSVGPGMATCSGLLALPGPQTKQTGARGPVSGHLGLHVLSCESSVPGVLGGGERSPRTWAEFPRGSKTRHGRGQRHRTDMAWCDCFEAKLPKEEDLSFCCALEILTAHDGLPWRKSPCPQISSRVPV